MNGTKHKEWMERAKAKLYPYLYRKPLNVAAYLENFNSRRAR